MHLYAQMNVTGAYERSSSVYHSTVFVHHNSTLAFLPVVFVVVVAVVVVSSLFS